MNLKLFLRGDKEYKKLCFRFHFSKKDYHYTSEIFCKDSDWDKKNNNFKPTFPNFEENYMHLKSVKTLIYENFYDDYKKGVIINSDWLKKIVLKAFNRKEETEEKRDIFFYDYIKWWTETAIERKQLLYKSERLATFKDLAPFRSCVKLVESYEKLNGIRIKHVDVNKDLKILLKGYAIDGMLWRPSTTATIMKRMNYLVREASDSKLPVNLSFTRVPNVVSLDEEKLKDPYLTEEEIHRIYNLKIQDKSLSDSRDLFIVGLWTGLRVSDFSTIKAEMFSTGVLKLPKGSKKTKMMQPVPVHNHIREIITKHKGEIPLKSKRYIKQQFNKDIKQICKLAKVNEVMKGMLFQSEEVDGKMVYRKSALKELPKYNFMTSHTARRSFATNLNNRGFNLQTIMALTGWNEEKITMHYIKDNKSRAASESLADNWDMEIKPINLDELKQ